MCDKIVKVYALDSAEKEWSFNDGYYGFKMCGYDKHDDVVLVIRTLEESPCRSTMALLKGSVAALAGGWSSSDYSERLPLPVEVEKEVVRLFINNKL